MARLRLIVGFVFALFGLCQLASPVPVAWAQSSPQRIVAVVNDDVITSQDLIDRLALALATSGLPNNPESMQRLAPQVMRGLVDEKLQLQEAARLNLTVSEQEIDNAMDTIAQRNKTNRAELVRFLTDRQLNPRTLREQLRAQIAWIKVVGRVLRPRIVVTQEQIDLALKHNVAATADTEVLLSEISAAGLRPRPGSERAPGRAGSGRFDPRRRRSFGSGPSGVGRGQCGERRRSRLGARERDQLRSPPADRRPQGRRGFRADRQCLGRAYFRGARPPDQRADGEIDRDKVRATLEQAQLDREVSRYLRDLRRDAFIDVRQ